MFNLKNAFYTMIFLGVAIASTQTISAGPKSLYHQVSNRVHQPFAPTKNHMVNLNDGNVNETLNNQIVIIDFYSDWCAPCRRFGPVFEKVAGDMNGKLTFAKLNADKAPKTIKRFGVTMLPTILIVKDGKEIKRKTNVCDEVELKKFINSAL